ncbi:MAG: hypothetical protein ABSG83_09995 [Roseiarcus sp.]|jgi:hypothetical protein
MDPNFANCGASRFEVMSRLAGERAPIRLGEGLPDDPGPAGPRARAADGLS